MHQNQTHDLAVETSSSEQRTSRSQAGDRKARTQEKILGSATRLFATRGYQRTSVAQIAAHSGVSRASIFWHFGDKDTLFQESCRHLLIPFRSSLEGSGEAEDPRERILQQIEAYDAFVTSQSEVIHAFVSWVFSSESHAQFLGVELGQLHRAFERRLQQDLRSLLGDDDAADRYATTIVTLLHGNMLMSLAGFAQQSEGRRSVHVVDQVKAMLAQALRE